jgi:hypothetical protein
MNRTPTVLLILAAACSYGFAGNPTGDCEPETDGSRVCYHSPEAGDTYLPDCEAPLDRELWRVFATEDGGAYIIPRPDGMGLSTGICDGDDIELAAAFERSGLCDEVADPEVINDLNHTDALVITHALHEQLVFTAVDDGDGSAHIDPWAPDEDMLAACDGPLADETAVDEACDLLAGRSEDGNCTDIGVIYSLEQATLFAAGLNHVYGGGVE